MRTRFLNIDYFHSASETLDFLRLQLPHLPPSTISSYNDLRHFDDFSVPSVSLEVETFPIGTALSKFLSDVLPQLIDVDIGDFSDSSSCYPNSDFYDQRRFSSKSSVEIQISEKENDTSFGGKGENSMELTQFETPELDLFVENAYFYEKEGTRVFSEIQEADNILDMLNPELTVEYADEVQESVYSIDDITPKYCMEEQVMEGDGSLVDQFHLYHGTFPLLEVDEIGLGIFSSKFIEDEFLQLLENIEPKDGTQKGEVEVDGNELLGSTNIDLLEHTSDHFLSKQRFEAELACLKAFLEMDIFGVIEIPHLEGISTFNLGTPDDLFSVSLFLFEDFHFLDLYSSQVFEVFPNLQTLTEPGKCEQMFREDMKIKKFDELITSPELTLLDDSFKSLPVPILSDNEMITSVNSLLEEMLAKLKTVSLSTSDGIYLDWYLLENDRCNYNMHTYQRMLEEIDNYNTDSDLECIDHVLLVLDFVFSGDTPNGPITEESKAMLNMSTGNVAVVHGLPKGVALGGKLPDNKCRKPGIEVVTDMKIEKVQSLVGSMSQFNDLDFFLNPRQATSGKNNEPDKEPQGFEFTMGVPCSTSPFNESTQNMEELLNFLPGAECNMGPSTALERVEACCTTLPTPSVPLATESEQLRAMHSFPDAGIIVNTQNVEKEMIISRRSTYQKILAIEKEGVQIVERDLNLPVDVIISASVCLAWYDCSNFGKKATAPDEASSCLPLCIENIAANVLTSLSFTFSGCILIFEGESSLLAAVMEFSDELYAAAASLGIDLQLFCSYSSELTDDIILNCIGRATELTRGIYAKMSESETLGEAFLSVFLSINPLSAHAILSSGGTLVEFLKWSHEQRICALQKYHVPDESVALFSALCKYGEREDSRSGTTDCSSSVSSAPDSDHCHCKNGSGRKKQKYIDSDIPMVDIINFESLQELPDGSLDCPTMSKPYDSWISKSSGISDKFKNTGASFDDKCFGQKHVAGIAALNSYGVCKPYDSRMSKGYDISGDVDNSSLPLKDKLFGEQQEMEMALRNKVGERHNNNHSNLQDFVGEVIDIDDSSLLDEDFSFANSKYFTPSVPETEKDPASGKSRTASKSLFGRNCLPTFLTSDEINSDSEVWISVKDHGQSLRGGVNRHSDEDFKNDLPLEHQKKLIKESTVGKAATNFHRLSFQERDASKNGGKLLSTAIHSAQTEQGSPWTMEFLNRIRQKSRLRQQSLPRDMSSCVGYSGNISKVTKRKSPSILDFYRYQGGSNSTITFGQKRQKRSAQPSTSSTSSKNKKTSASLLPTWTPNDKRARRMLSFAPNGGGGQSKLVWSDKNAQTLNRRF